jgi:hypothetical protein
MRLIFVLLMVLVITVMIYFSFDIYFQNKSVLTAASSVEMKPILEYVKEKLNDVQYMEDIDLHPPNELSKDYFAYKLFNKNRSLFAYLLIYQESNQCEECHDTVLNIFLDKSKNIIKILAPIPILDDGKTINVDSFFKQFNGKSIVTISEIDFGIENIPDEIENRLTTNILEILEVFGQVKES